MVLENAAIFAFGVVFVATILVLAFAFPHPTPFQYTVVRIILAVSTAGVATLLTGFLKVEVPGYITAGGALAVFVIVYFKSPAALVTAIGPAVDPAAKQSSGATDGVPIPKHDPPDEYWPREPDPAKVKDTPILLMHSPLDVDRAKILRILDAFGRAWPAAEIRWPRSSTLLREALDRALKEQHRLDLKHQSAGDFLKNARREIVEAEQGCSRAAARLPGLVRRCTFLDDDPLATVLERFLVLANYKAHWMVLSRMSQARKIGFEFETPKSWEIFSGDKYRVLYDTVSAQIWRGQLVSIAGHPVVGDHGPGLWVYGPRYVFEHRRMMDRGMIDLSLIAQIECESPGESELPPTYEGEWHIAFYAPGGSGIGLPGEADERRKTDREIEAELALLREKWQASGKRRL